MRTTLNLADDALLVAKQVATRERVSLGEAVSRLVRQGAGARSAQTAPSAPLRGRFALLPCRDEVITPGHIRELMEREAI
jgi:hypothetical protein